MELVYPPPTLRVCDQSFAQGLTVGHLKATWPTPVWYYAIWFVHEAQLPAGTFADADLSDPANLTLSATLAGGGALPAWLTFDAATRTFSGTPADDDAGAVTVEVTATDGVEQCSTVLGRAAGVEEHAAVERREDLAQRPGREAPQRRPGLAVHQAYLDPERVATVTFDSYSTIVDVEAAEQALQEFRSEEGVVAPEAEAEIQAIMQGLEAGDEASAARTFDLTREFPDGDTHTEEGWLAEGNAEFGTGHRMSDRTATAYAHVEKRDRPSNVDRCVMSRTRISWVASSAPDTSPRRPSRPSSVAVRCGSSRGGRA